MQSNSWVLVNGWNNYILAPLYILWWKPQKKKKGILNSSSRNFFLVISVSFQYKNKEDYPWEIQNSMSPF